MLCYSTGSLPPFPIHKILDILQPTPFRGIELVMTPEMLFHSPTDPFWKKFKDEVEARGFCVRNIHLGNPLLLSATPHEPGMAAKTADFRNLRLMAAEKSIEIAWVLDSPHVTLTSGLQSTGISMEQSLQLVRESLTRIIEFAGGKTLVCLEQEPEMIIHSTEQLHYLCSDFPGQLGITFDVGHAQVLGENIPQSIQMLFPWIKNLHLEDILNRKHQHLLFGEGEINFQEIFSTLSQSGYRGDLTPDLYPFVNDYAKALNASIEIMQNFGSINE